MTIITGDLIPLFRLHTLLSGLKLELKGIRMTNKGRSCYAIIKSELGFTGSKQNVYNQLESYLNAKL